MDQNKPCILLAERSAGLRGELREALEAAGCRVREARDGAQALSLAREGSAVLDLLLLDQSLPGASGASLACDLYQQGLRFKVALLKGVRDHKFHAAQLPAGAVAAVLDKARPVEDLLYAVNNLLYVGGAGGRRWPRVPIKAMAQYRTEEGWQIGRVWDLSHGGLQLRAKQGLTARTLLELKFFLPRLMEPVEAQALVQWNRAIRAETNQGASHGLEFVELPREARREIGQLVDRRLDELLHHAA